MAAPSPTTTVDANTRDFYQQISHWLNEFFQLTSSTDIEYAIRSSSTTISGILTTSGGTDGSYTRSFPYEPTNRISIPSATITPIPSTITEQQTSNPTGTSVYRSGYILSLNMLWLSADEKLFLWKYPSMTDLIELEFDSIVLACNCVRRRKSTTTSVTKKLTHSTSFLGSWLPSMISSASKHPPTLTSNDLIEHFIHLLIILTSQDILIYTIDDQTLSNVQRWYTTPTMKYALNQIGYFDCLSTSNERFFLGGQCGDIYEFVYEENIKSALNKLGQTFLSNLVPSFLQLGGGSSGPASSMAVKQICLDHHRALLYARLANDSLHIYDVSSEKGQRLFTYTFDELISKVKQRQTISYDDYRPFLTMYAVQAHESSLFNLILVTHTGIRLYYTLISSTGQNNGNNPPQQSRLELIHFRYPPTIPNLPQSNTQQTVFRTGYVDMNCLFLFTTDPNRPQTFGRMVLLINSDSTLLTSTTLLSSNFNDATLNQQQQQQQQQLQQRPLAEVQSQLFNELFLIQEQISLFTLNIAPLHVDLTQSIAHLPRIGPLAQNLRYMIQTYDSIVTFDIPRSIEHLRSLLFYDHQIHSLLMKQFFSYYSLRYSCSMSLALTLSSNVDASNPSRMNDDRLRDLAFQTFLWYSSSAYLQYLETLQQQQQMNQFSTLDQTRLYQYQPQQPFNRSTTILPSIFLRQRNFFERYIIPLRINAVLFVLSDILRPIWTQNLIELKSLSKQDKTIYYIFHRIHDYPDIKSLLKQLQYFLKKLAPHMCCTWSTKDDLPEYNEQLAQRIYAPTEQSTSWWSNASSGCSGATNTNGQFSSDSEQSLPAISVDRPFNRDEPGSGAADRCSSRSQLSKHFDLCSITLWTEQRLEQFDQRGSSCGRGFHFVIAFSNRSIGHVDSPSVDAFNVRDTVSQSERDDKSNAGRKRHDRSSRLESTIFSLRFVVVVDQRSSAGDRLLSNDLSHDRTFERIAIALANHHRTSNGHVDRTSTRIVFDLVQRHERTFHRSNSAGFGHVVLRHVGRRSAHVVRTERIDFRSTDGSSRRRMSEVVSG